MVTWHKFKMAAISTENSSTIYFQFHFSIEHSSWLSSRKANSCTFMYVYKTTADKKHKKLGKWHSKWYNFKSITSEVLNYIIADTHWELICNDKFHLGNDPVYIINHWYLNDKSFPLRSHRKCYSPILSNSPLPSYYHLHPHYHVQLHSHHVWWKDWSTWLRQHNNSMACKTILQNDSYMHDCCSLSRH